MRLRRKTIVGKIDSKGNLSAPWKILEDFCSMHKDRKLILRAEIMPKEPSEKTKGYFFGYIVEELQGFLMEVYGERFTKEQSYDWIRKQCPFFAREERVDGEWKSYLIDFEDLDQAEANEVIEWTIQYCAENFNQILDYPL